MKKAFRYCARLLSAALAAALLISLCGCVDFVSKFYSPTTEPQATAPDGDEEAPLLTDYEGNRLSFTRAPQRIICATPIATEIICGLGMGKNIIMIDSYSDAGEDKPSGAGVIAPFTATAEEVLAYESDCIFYSDSYSFNSITSQQLKEAGATMIWLPDTGSVQTAEANIRFLAAVMFCPGRGETVIQNMREEIRLIKVAAEYNLIEGGVYIEFSPPENLRACGGELIVSELCAYAGLTNIFGSESGIISPTKQTVIEKDPEYIISICQYQNYFVSEISDRSGWENVKAIKNGNVKHITPSYAIRPTQNIIKALKEIAAVVGIVK